MHKHARVLVAIALYGNEAVETDHGNNDWSEPKHPEFLNPFLNAHRNWRIHPDYEDKVPTLAEIEGWRK